MGPQISQLLTNGVNDVQIKKSKTGLIPENWSLKKLRELVSNKNHSLLAGPFGTIFKAKDFRKMGVRIIQLRHITENGFVWGDNETYMDLNIYERIHKPYTVLPGDLLITKMGEPPGIACIYPQDSPLAMVTPDVVKATIEPNIVDSRYLKHLYNSPLLKIQIQKLTKGATRPRVSLNELFELLLPIPPLPEQKEIAVIMDNMESIFVIAKRSAVDANSFILKLTGELFAL